MSQRLPTLQTASPHPQPLTATVDNQKLTMNDNNEDTKFTYKVSLHFLSIGLHYLVILHYAGVFYPHEVKNNQTGLNHALVSPSWANIISVIHFS